MAIKSSSERSTPEHVRPQLTTRGRSAHNQFLSWRVPVKEHLKKGANELVITFANAFAKVHSQRCNYAVAPSDSVVQGRELEKKHGKFGLWNGDSSRLHVRKAQYK